MQISIVDQQHDLSPEIREFAERRLLFALSRFASRINGVVMDIADTNGLRGGTDKTCSVTVKLRRLEDVRVSSADAHAEASIARAAERAGRAVARAIQHSQQFHRRRARIF